MWKIVARLALIVCTLICLIGIQLATCEGGIRHDPSRRAVADDILEAELSGKTKEKVEERLKRVLYKETTWIWGYLNVAYLLKITELPTKTDCDPDNIEDFGNLLDFLDKEGNKEGNSGLKEYVDDAFKRLQPVCVENIRILFENKLKGLQESIRDFIFGTTGPRSRIYFNHQECYQACETVRKLHEYIEIMNRDKSESPPIDEVKNLLINWKNYQRHCLVYKVSPTRRASWY